LNRDDTPPLLRSIRPTRATTSLAASVDPTDARKATVRRFGRSHRRAQRAGSGPALGPCSLSLAWIGRMIKWFWDALSS